MRLSPLAALAALVALAMFPTFAAPAHAERAGAPRRSAPAARLGAWLDGAKAQVILRPWSKCSQLGEMLRFRARLGGGLLAVYDRERDQHRWLLASERDTAAPKHFEVLSFCGDVALVRTSLEQEEELWVIDVARGLTRKLARRGSFRMAGKARLQIDPANEEGERELLPLTALGGC